MIPTADIDVPPSLLGKDLHQSGKLNFPVKLCTDENSSLYYKEFEFGKIGISSRRLSQGTLDPRPQTILVSPRDVSPDEIYTSNVTKDAREANILQISNEKSELSEKEREENRRNCTSQKNDEPKAINYALDTNCTSSAQEKKCSATEKSSRKSSRRRKSCKAKRKRSCLRRVSMCTDISKPRGKVSIGSKLKAKFFGSSDKGDSKKQMVLQRTYGEIPKSSSTVPVKFTNKNTEQAVKLPRVARSVSLDSNRIAGQSFKPFVKSLSEDSALLRRDNNAGTNAGQTLNGGTQITLAKHGSDLPNIDTGNNNNSPRKNSERTTQGPGSDCDLFTRSVNLSPRKPAQSFKAVSTPRLQTEAVKTQSNDKLADRSKSYQSLISPRKVNDVTNKRQVVKGATNLTRHESLRRQRHSTFPHDTQAKKVFGGSLISIPSPRNEALLGESPRPVGVSSDQKGRQIFKSRSTTKLDAEKLRDEERERKRTQREEDRRSKEIQNKRKQLQRLEIYALNKIMTEFENTNFERFMEENSSVSSLPV